MWQPRLSPPAAGSHSRSPFASDSDTDHQSMMMQRSSQTTIAVPFTTAEVMQENRASTPYRLATPRADLQSQMNTTPPLTKGAKIRAMIKCVNDLRHIGVENTVPLPRICVIGDQSAGKSSLVEALSDIKIPRADGCCTRCVLEINLTGTDQPEDEWQCKVYLTLAYDHERKPTKKGQKTNQQRPLGPWTQRVSEKCIDFGQTNDKNQVPGLVQRAQLAILNPDQEPLSFATSQISAESALEKFSPNTVRLDIQGPGYCNLSFVDLPGIIKNTEHKEESFLVELVQNLTRGYIEMDNCILILTLPMTNDIENCNAFDLLRKTSHADERALGVITKSDRAGSQTTLTTWQDRVLGHQDYHLGLGYHAVMMSGDTDLPRGIMLELERGFFDGENWSRVAAQASTRLGIPALSTLLEDLLAARISEDLPSIIIEISKRAAQVTERLAKIPTRTFTDCPEFILGQLTHDFDIRLRTLFKGHGSEHIASELKTKWNDLAESFRNCLLNTRPILDPSAASEKKLMVKLRATTAAMSPERAVKSNKPTSTVVVVGSSDEDANEQFGRFKGSYKSFTFEDISGYNSRSNHTTLLDSKTPGAVEEMNKISVAHWRGPIKLFMDLTRELIYEEVRKVASVVFTDYHTTDLYQEVLKTISKFLNDKGEEQYHDAIRTYRMEHEHPLTFDRGGLKREKRLMAKRLSKTRNDYRLELAQARLDAEGPTKGKARVVKEEDLEPDEYDTEIEIMAEVQSYYKLAASRCVDSVCLSIHARLFATCARELKDQVRSDLGLANDMGITGAHSGCRTFNESLADDFLAASRAKIISLMSDKSERQQERAALLEEKDRLRKARVHIKQVLGGGQDDDEDDEMEDVDAIAFIRDKSNTNDARTPSKTATPARRTVGTPIKPAVTPAKRTPVKQEDSTPQRTPASAKRQRLNPSVVEE